MIKFCSYLIVVLNCIFFSICAQTWTQIGQDIDGEFQHDHSGSSVSISNDGLTVAIGAEGNDGNGTNSGQVRVYQYNGTNWTQIGQDINGEFSQDFSGDYWSVALNASGNIVAIGAKKNNNSNGSDAGHVRVYQYNGVNWVKIGQDIDGENGNDFSGKSVDISDDGFTVTIGADGNDGNGSSSGHTRIYQYNGSNWIQLGGDIDGESSANYSGCSVGISADGLIVAIGAYGNDNTNGTDAGHVRVYQYNGANWIQLGQDIDGEAAGDFAGWAVDLSANGLSVIISSRLNDGNGSNAGRARVFNYNGINWVQKGQSIDGEFANNNCWVVAISDDASTIAYSSKDNTSNTGSVRVYKYSGGSWVKQGLDIDGENGNDFSGYSVSFSYGGDTIAIGAIYNDGSYTNAGHVRVYTLDSPLPITLLSFTGESENNYNVLEWETATEINNDYFTLFSSKDAEYWEEIEIINGAGNSNALLNYQSFDFKFSSPVTYYQLKQTDFDGTSSYSKIIAVYNINENNKFSIYPNPINNYVNVLFNNEFGENVEIKVSNSLGEIIKMLKFNGNKLKIDLSNNSKGMYFISLIKDNRILFNQKIVKQ